MKYVPACTGKFPSIFAAILLLFVLSADVRAQVVATDTLDYYPGDTVFITGSGFMPGETVQLVFQIYPDPIPNDTLYALADAAGDIYNEDYIIQLIHLGQAFDLTATGIISGLVAQTFFFDSPRIVAVNITPSSQSVCLPASGSIVTSYTVLPVRGANGTVN
jgi:hypothetical protein